MILIGTIDKTRVNHKRIPKYITNKTHIVQIYTENRELMHCVHVGNFLPKRTTKSHISKVKEIWFDIYLEE